MQQKSDEQLLIKQLKGSQLEMNRAITWILQKSGWKDSLLILINQYQMDRSIQEETFYEAITAFTMNIRKNQFNADSNLKTYFEGICKNMLRTKLTNKTKNASRFVNMDHTQITQREEVDLEAKKVSERRTEIQELLDKMIHKLGENCKKVLGYVRLDYSMQEIADTLNMEKQSIKNSAFKCRKQLREIALANPSLLNAIKELV